MLEAFPATNHHNDYLAVCETVDALGLKGDVRSAKITHILDHEYFAHFIPDADVPAIAEELSGVIAEVITWWLDAGSEREVTLEELTPVIEEHLRGWGSLTS